MIRKILKRFIPEWLLKLYRLLKRLCLDIKMAIRIFATNNKCRRLYLPPIYSDHMILQCNKPLSIEGTARRGSKVTLRLAGKEVKTRTPDNGCWKADIGSMPAGGPYVLEVEARGKRLRYNDVYFGEVWICSGQSNMVVPVDSYNNDDPEKESILRTGGRPLAAPYRCLRIEPMAAMQPYPIEWKSWWIFKLINQHKYTQTKGWEDCSRTVTHLSAVAYYFGTELAEKLGTPVGLIVNPLGGAAEYGWIRRSLIEQHCPQLLSDYFENSLVTEWMKGRARTNLGKRLDTPGQLHPYFPGYCYETYVRPIAGYGVKGVVWFSGESSAQIDEMPLYSLLTELIVRNWREHWGEDMPFYYAQLHGMIYEQTFGAGLHYYYPQIRECQRRLLYSLPKVGMAVSYDLSVPNNPHFSHRKPMGERFARLALHHAYGHKEVVPNGPLYRDTMIDGGSLRLRFDYAEGLHTTDGAAVGGFAVAGADRVFYPAKASIEGEEVVLACPSGLTARYLHYAFEAYPIAANLVNGERLPAAAFEVEITDKYVNR